MYDARQAGGHAKANTARMQRLMPATLRPVLQTLLAVLDEVHSGNLEPSRANAVAALGSAIVRVYQVGQLEERLAALEQTVGRKSA
jgi:hypothetical protein